MKKNNKETEILRKKIIDNLIKRIEKNEEFVFGLSYEDETTSFYTNNYFEVTKEKADNTYYFVIDTDDIYAKVDGSISGYKQELIKVYDSFKEFVTKAPADSIVGTFITKSITLNKIYDVTSLTSSKDLEELLAKLAFVINATIAVLDGNGVI